MFRTLRSRRRPRYGAYVCAVMAAVLLLLSVTLLHSRLTFSRQNSRRFRLPSDGVVTTDPILDDPDFGITVSENDDRIDELDVVEENDQSRVSEEEILRGVEMEEDQSEQTRVSGFYFDHVSGAIRRPFDKRSIDKWEDYVGFDVGLGVDDRSMGVFGSDDVVVDEEVRRKLGEVTGVEDALLLKTGRRESLLREGWAVWFDAKSDFLRRDRMFKSNLELLNPLNNPLLQDPDSIGVTTLTRGDKLVQKGLLNGFKKVPFHVKKSLSVNAEETTLGVEVAVEKGDDSGKKNVLEGIVEGRPEIKRVDRRTLDDHDASNHSYNSQIVNSNEALSIANSLNSSLYKSNGNEVIHGNSVESNGNEVIQGNSVESNGKIVDSSIGELKNVDSNFQIKSEFSGHLYADGKRWGHFPGLHPHLSFSNFMNRFFRKCKCSMRVFMVWNSPPWMFSVRHQRALESLFFHHQDVCVVVFSETIELDFFKDFVKDGFKIAVAMPNLDELLRDTPTYIFASVWFEWRRTTFYSTHYSELVRLAALYKYGGIYLDSDILVLKPLSLLNNSVATEDQIAGSSLNGAVMAFSRHSLFLMECLREFYLTYDDTRLRWNGADLLTRVAKNFSSNESTNNKSMELKVLPSSIFFPISPQNITRYFAAPVTNTEKAQQDVVFQKILNDSFTFHFWNSLTSAIIPDPGSLVARFFDHSCIRCSDLL